MIASVEPVCNEGSRSSRARWQPEPV